MVKSDLSRLKRKQVDDLLKPYAFVPRRGPKGGWLRTLRTALGMSMEQLGARIGRPKQAVQQLEHNEVSGAITLAKLQLAANAMDCDMIVVLLPRAGSIEKMVRQQALRKARKLHSSVVHTMALEAQSDGLEKDPDLEAEVHWWLSQNAARLWD